MGQYHRRKQKHRGTRIVSPSTLSRRLRWSFKASDLKMEHLPLVKGKETSHILISGTTGAGKSNAFHILMPQIRQKKHRALVVDMTGGSLISRFYQPETDLILNPFDERSQNWNPWLECVTSSHFDALAEAVIPQKKTNYDPFWDDAGRSLLSVALQKLKAAGEPKVSALYTLLTHAGVQEFHNFFAGTEAATFADKQGERTTMSIRFRSGDPETTSWISKILGESEETEVIENISYGANTMRDGVSLNQQTKTKPLVLPTEIANLPDLVCFVKYPGNFPITKLKMTYQKAGNSQIPFQIREQDTVVTVPETQESFTFEIFKSADQTSLPHLQENTPS